MRAVASVASGPVWLRASFATDGTAVQRVGGGFAIPLDAAGADPAALSAVLGPSSSAWIGQLRRGRAVLSRTSAALRRVGPGATFQLTTGTIGVGAVAPDVQVGAHEVFLSSRMAATLGVVHPAYLLVRLARAADPARAVRAIRSLLTPGPPVRIRSQARTAYLRQADGVLPPEWSKVYFGEFAARPGPGGTLVMDPAWERAHITQARVPILGVVRCNRALLAPLRGALSRVRREGLGSLVDRRDFGGCFAARLTRGSSAVISAHAWGAAVDVNVSRNLLGETPHQDPRLVEAFTRMGFVWGGRFLLPDGMHFEYGCPDRYGIPEQVRVPDPLLRLALCRPG